MAVRGARVLRTEVLDDPDALEPWLEAWDDLAVSTGHPFCAPAWMLAWWRHAVSEGARLRTILVLEGQDLAGIAPMYVQRAFGGLARYRVVAASRSYRTEPLAAPGRETEVARALTAALASTEPRPDLVTMEIIGAGSPWPAALADAWPGPSRPWAHRDRADVAPALRLEGRTFDQWFAGKSRNFRQQLRRAERQLGEKGAVPRMVTDPVELAGALEAFGRLHNERWEWRGGSRVLSGGVDRMLRDAGETLVPDGRFRLWMIEAGATPISAHLFLAAGGEVCYWLGGFDQAWAPFHPSLVTILAAIRDAFDRGDRRVDLGWGGQPYKYRFADGDDTLEWWTLVPRGRRYPSVRLRLAPRMAARSVAERLPETAKARVKALVGRTGRLGSDWLR
jgi:CelD/BcsL family acetyltransferase involved in cellulose biosynthesis